MLGGRIAEATEAEFFRWFHLARYEKPRTLADGAIWHGFRPEGVKFRDLVTVNLEADKDRLTDATLCLDRAFVEHPKDGAFARDITASYLRWALGASEQEALADVLAELGDLGPNVIRLAGAPAPAIPAQPTELYAAYLGRSKQGERLLPGKRLLFNNLQARDGPRDPRHDWIWIRILLT